MISCTEFIPLYSEFFKFLEQKGGHEAVKEYWHFISDSNIGDLTNENSLGYKCSKLGGFEGAMSYWGHTLTEEACDMFEVRDNDKRFYYSHMRHCPSKGRLIGFEHIEPYYDYCEHCNVIYQRVLDKYGVVYERDHSRIDEAECRSILYEKGNKPDFDFKTVNDSSFSKSSNVSIVDLKSEDNKYLHRDFHLLGDNALKYCGDNYGKEKVCLFLEEYVKNYYSPRIKSIKKGGLEVLKNWIEEVYDTEEAREYLHTDLSDNKLTIIIEKSPVIEYMQSLNQKPSEYYIEETRTLYAVIAKESNLIFELEYYNEDGAAKFTFSCK